MKIDINKLEWQSGAVKGFEGKELLKELGGTMKLVRVEPGVNYPLHRHVDKTEFAYVLEGQAEFEVDGEVYLGEKGDFITFPVTKRHAIKNMDQVKCLLLLGAIQIELK